MENAVEIRRLCKRYRGFALEEVSFDVPRGYIMGLIGPNGAGKTTIIKLLMGLVRRDAGEIRLFGEDAERAGASLRSRVGFVYEAPCFPEDATLGEISAAVAPFYHRWDRERFASLVEEFEIPSRRRFKKLSQGMQTKLALAVALSHHAELIVMDEPTSGLDPAARRRLLDMLQDLIAGGTASVLLSTHITSDLERVADYVTLLHRGRRVFSTSRDELRERYAVVKGPPSLASRFAGPTFHGMRRGEVSFRVLTSDAASVRGTLGAEVVVEPATLQDIMDHIGRSDP
jgi:ABC-2 type transport system ATP-binding protein